MSTIFVTGGAGSIRARFPRDSRLVSRQPCQVAAAVETSGYPGRFLVIAEQLILMVYQSLGKELSYAPLIFLRRDQIIRAMRAARHNP